MTLFDMDLTLCQHACIINEGHANIIFRTLEYRFYVSFSLSATFVYHIMFINSTYSMKNIVFLLYKIIP